MVLVDVSQRHPGHQLVASIDISSMQGTFLHETVFSAQIEAESGGHDAQLSEVRVLVCFHRQSSVDDNLMFVMLERLLLSPDVSVGSASARGDCSYRLPHLNLNNTFSHSSCLLASLLELMMLSSLRD